MHSVARVRSLTLKKMMMSGPSAAHRRKSDHLLLVLLLVACRVQPNLWLTRPLLLDPIALEVCFRVRTYLCMPIPRFDLNFPPLACALACSLSSCRFAICNFACHPYSKRKCWPSSMLSAISSSKFLQQVRQACCLVLQLSVSAHDPRANEWRLRGEIKGTRIRPPFPSPLLPVTHLPFLEIRGAASSSRGAFSSTHTTRCDLCAPQRPSSCRASRTSTA